MEWFNKGLILIISVIELNGLQQNKNNSKSSWALGTFDIHIWSTVENQVGQEYFWSPQCVIWYESLSFLANDLAETKQNKIWKLRKFADQLNAKDTESVSSDVSICLTFLWCVDDNKSQDLQLASSSLEESMRTKACHFPSSLFPDLAES